MSDTRCTPGATTSGLARASNQVGPRELNPATTSPSRAIDVLRVDRADRDARGRVGRRIDAGVAGFAVAVLIQPVVAGRDDHHDAGPDRALDGLHERVVLRRRVNGMAERQVDDLDVEGAVVGDDVLDRLDDHARRALALAVEHLQRDELAPPGRRPGARSSTARRRCRAGRPHACRARSRHTAPAASAGRSSAS